MPTLTAYVSTGETTTDTISVSGVVIASGDALLVFSNQPFNGTPYITTLAVNANNKTIERLNTGTGDYERKGVYINPTNLSEPGTHTVTATYDSSFYGGKICVVVMSGYADQAAADKPTVVTGTGTSATINTAASQAMGTFIGILGSSDNAPNSVGSGDTELATISSFAGGASIIYEDNSGTVTINGGFASSSSYVFDAGHFDHAAAGGGDSFPYLLKRARSMAHMLIR